MSCTTSSAPATRCKQSHDVVVLGVDGDAVLVGDGNGEDGRVASIEKERQELHD